METAFDFTADENGPIYQVRFTGELIGGSDLASDKFQKLIRQIKTEAQSRVVLLDIRKVAFWDTEGMRETLGLAHKINSDLSSPRVYIVAPKNGYLFKRAVEKYQDKVDNTIPWIEDPRSLGGI